LSECLAGDAILMFLELTLNGRDGLCSASFVDLIEVASIVDELRDLSSQLIAYLFVFLPFIKVMPPLLLNVLRVCPSDVSLVYLVIPYRV